MFQPASTLEKTVRLKALLMGRGGVGKSTVAITTCPRPVGAILCEGDTALDYPYSVLRDDEGLSTAQIDKVLKYTRVSDWDSMIKAVAAARELAEKGEIETLVVDPLNFFADRLIDQCFVWHKTKEGNEDGRKAHPECAKRLRQICYQLVNSLPCHVIVVSHFLDVGDAAKKGGPDKVPLLPNQEARAIVHGMFPHKLWMEMQEGKRVFVMTPEGYAGPGVRGYRGASTLPADIGTLMSALRLPGADEISDVARRALKSNGNSTSKASAPKPAPAPTRAQTPNRPPTSTPTRNAQPRTTTSTQPTRR